MSNIEDDVKYVKEMLEIARVFFMEVKAETDYKDVDEIAFCNAISNILSEREQDKARIKELEEENGTLKRVNNIIKNIDIENATQKIDDYYNEFMRNFIPKQKIKNKIEEYYKKMEEDNKNISWIITDRIVLNVLEELLQEEDK